ncbi:MAG: hypothetical protein QMC67_16955 [Candidatus Wallbacteria bacterium]
MTGKIDTSAVKGKVSAKTVAVVSAALMMHLQKEKSDYRILSIKPVHSSDVNLWGLYGRMTNMGHLRKHSW